MSIFSSENPNVLSPYLLSFFFDPVPNEPPPIPNEFSISSSPKKRQFSDKNGKEVPQKKQRRCRNNPISRAGPKYSEQPMPIIHQIKYRKSLLKQEVECQKNSSTSPDKEHSELAEKQKVITNQRKYIRYLKRQYKKEKGSQHSSASPNKKPTQDSSCRPKETIERTSITHRLKHLKKRLVEIEEQQMKLREQAGQ